MRVRGIVALAAVLVIVMAFWPALGTVLERLDLGVVPGRSSLTWVDAMVMIALGILALRIAMSGRDAHQQHSAPPPPPHHHPPHPHEPPHAHPSERRPHR